MTASSTDSPRSSAIAGRFEHPLVVLRADLGERARRCATTVRQDPLRDRRAGLLACACVMMLAQPVDGPRRRAGRGRPSRGSCAGTACGRDPARTRCRRTSRRRSCGRSGRGSTTRPPVMYSQPWSPTPSTTAVAPELRTQNRSPTTPRRNTSPAGRAVEDHVAGDDVLLGDERRRRGGGSSDERAARQALADVVVRVAFEPQRDARAARTHRSSGPPSRGT